MKEKAWIKLRAHAKINLSLGVGARREDGYHEIRSLMQGVELADGLTACRGEAPEAGAALDVYRFMCSGCSFAFYADGSQVPMSEENLIVKGVKILAARAEADGVLPEEGLSLSLLLEKELPVAAGIAGGSGNGAAAMLALNAFLGYPYDLRTLMSVGEGVGADVPFSIFMNAAYNREALSELPGLEEAATAAWVSGLGEIIEPCEARGFDVLLANPGVAVSTAEVYRGMDAMERISGEGALFTNDMEDYTFAHYPQAKALTDALKAHAGAEQVLMSGSGPTIAAYYPPGKAPEEEAVRSAAWWDPSWRLWATRTGGRHEGL